MKRRMTTPANGAASSAFEGMRAYATPRGPAVMQLERHVERLFRSCRVIELPIEHSPRQISEGILETIRRNGHDSCYIRPLVFRGYGELGVDPRGCPSHVVIATWPLGAYFTEEARTKGLSLGVSSWRRMAPNWPSAIRTETSKNASGP